MRALFPAVGPRVSLALLILRVVVGISFFVHGAPKLAHPASWDGAHGPLPGAPHWFQLLITIIENVGDWCIALGFLTPLVAFLQSCDMIGVAFVVKMAHGQPFSGAHGAGFELEAHILAATLAILLCGPGVFSIDALILRFTGRNDRSTRFAR